MKQIIANICMGLLLAGALFFPLLAILGLEWISVACLGLMMTAVYLAGGMGDA